MELKSLVPLRELKRLKSLLGRSSGGFVPPREGGCSTSISESLVICGLWNRVVKLMAKWHRVSTGGVSGGAKSHLGGFHRKNW